ncbi:MAG: hypothetical protein RBU37_22865 [Myxococcota bacterium]|jgi:hypothetical protein|nr:hypothetical protein [Myxococcota bacterium]
MHRSLSARSGVLFLGLLLTLSATLGTGCDDRAEAFFSMQEELATVVEQNAQDCDAMAAALEEFSSERGLHFARAEQDLLSLSKAQREAFQQEHAQRAAKLRERLAPLARCAEHPGVSAALEKLDFDR